MPRSSTLTGGHTRTAKAGRADGGEGNTARMRRHAERSRALSGLFSGEVSGETFGASGFPAGKSSGTVCTFAGAATKHGFQRGFPGSS
ncbi:MAG: hypothetical protein IPH06_13650 [Alphaproteobacteria bacterium]|nr:hypothetical protein [Alphaproteobacteria bacterium]